MGKTSQSIMENDKLASKAMDAFNLIIEKAIKYHASDIHFEPEQKIILIRFRVDGKMIEVGELPNELVGYLISRIKVISGMNISEKRIPQDGRMSMVVGDKPYTFRVASLPTMYGENIVMRILDQSSITRKVADLGFPQDILENFRQAYTRSNGIIFVTGPTGSGKTTTLYAVLNELNDGESNIISIEDPIEYELPGITQSQVNTAAGMTFHKGLRSMLRLDPDILMVGEIRDTETAKTAVEAAMTGHVVLSTLHTNDSTSAPTRLIEMGIEPFLISSTIRGILAQRLVRKLCPHCKEAYTLSSDVAKRILSYRPDNLTHSNDENIKQLWDLFKKNQQVRLYRNVGCDKCNNLGFKGRVPVYELMLMHEDIAQLIIKKSSSDAIRTAAYQNGMRTLLEDGLRLAIQGSTSIEEVFRVVV